MIKKIIKTKQLIENVPIEIVELKNHILDEALKKGYKITGTEAYRIIVKGYYKNKNSNG